MTAGAARFEFRAWGEGLDDVADRLLARAEPLEIRESAETYFVSSARVDANPKARADLLDIKVLVGVRDDYEQWGVRLKTEFPVGASLLTTELFPLLGLKPPVLEREAYSLRHLVDEVVPAHRDLAAVDVGKHRRLFAIDGCSAELTTAAIGGDELTTVAVESTDVAALRDARHVLGLDGRANVSYPRAIRRVLGGRYSETLERKEGASRGNRDRA